MARGTVDKDRAIGPRAASYLRGLDADERPIKGVHIDDPKAMFLFRWYQEVDANGNRLHRWRQGANLPEQGLQGLLPAS